LLRYFPPYWGLRDYGTEGQLGLEKTPEEYVSKLVNIFREVKRVLKKEGTVLFLIRSPVQAQLALLPRL
jgi:DNA methylase